MKRSGEEANRRTWHAAACVLIAMLAITSCEGGDIDSIARSGGGGAVTGSRPCTAGAAGSPAADTGTQAQSDRDCTLVDADGQPVCKLKSGRICTTNEECSSGVCKTIVVPPDPHDPYDLGYAYTGCE